MKRTPVDMVIGVLCVMFGVIPLLALVAPMSIGYVIDDGSWKQGVPIGLLFGSIGIIIYQARRTALYGGAALAFIVGLLAMYFAGGLVPFMFVLASYMFSRALGLFQSKC